MRILHTADWHLGKTLEGRSRHDEQVKFVDELCDIVKDEKVDVILIAGDVYDTVNPPAVSEQLFYEAVAKLSDNGKRPVIVIAGNHDSPERLASASAIAEKHGIVLIGQPVLHNIQVKVPQAGELLQIAALPYPSESRLKELFTHSQDESLLQKAYDHKIRSLLNLLCTSFHQKSVNIIMSHLFLAGGLETDSERPIQVGGAYTVSPASIPNSAQYVALGHLHRPQTISHPTLNIRYAGSPLAFSFSEAGQAKSVTIIDVHPGSKAETKEILLNSGKPLISWQASSIEELFTWLDEGRDRQSWVDVAIEVDDVLTMEHIQNIRKAHSGIVHIRPIFHFNNEEHSSESNVMNLPLDQLFKKFYERQTGGAIPDEQLVQLFFELVTDNE